MTIGDYFARDYLGTAFELSNPAHIGALLSVLLLNLFLLRFLNSSEAVRSRLRWVMALILWVNEIGWHVWNAVWGQWKVFAPPGGLWGVCS
ncbi:MAG: hypothetical protein Kow0088_04670 [Anaerolineales bacterium]